jgi:eukaryotic-like serine/threonine-protein kinase
MSEVQPGDVLEGRYVVEALLASGGQANVYQGRHVVLGRRVAIKILKLGLAPDALARMTRRFEQEAMLLSSLRDPHTITLFDYGKLGDGQLFMVFEYIHGQSLKELVTEGGPISSGRVSRIMTQILNSLQEAHALGVLHRDIKPQNIMIYEHAGRPDLIKVLDFGIAKVLNDDGEARENLTSANSLVGTPRYISPEIFRGEAPSAASDLYAVGLVCYELFVGKPAVLGATPMEVYRHQSSPRSIELPGSLDVPSGLRTIIHKLLRKPLPERYQSADAVLLDLQRWELSRSISGAIPTLRQVPATGSFRAVTELTPDELALPELMAEPLSDAADFSPPPPKQTTSTGAYRGVPAAAARQEPASQEFARRPSTLLDEEDDDDASTQRYTPSMPLPGLRTAHVTPAPTHIAPAAPAKPIARDAVSSARTEILSADALPAAFGIFSQPQTPPPISPPARRAEADDDEDEDDVPITAARTELLPPDFATPAKMLKPRKRRASQANTPVAAPQPAPPTPAPDEEDADDAATSVLSGTMRLDAASLGQIVRDRDPRARTSKADGGGSGEDQ